MATSATSGFSIQPLIDTIKNYYDSFFQFWSDFADSLKDFIHDLPTIFLKGATTIATSVLQWASDSLSSILGAGSVSSFAQNMQAAYNALPPCVIYALTQSGMVANLQILSAAMAVYTGMRALKFIMGIL